VATVHILPEVLTPGEATGQDHHGHAHGVANKDGVEVLGSGSAQYSKAIQVAAMVVGLVAPLGLTFLEDA
jgi:hypothetical protein